MAANSSITNTIWWTNALGAMYQRGEHTDVNLVVEGKNIAVHRSVLAALSPLFHQLLENKIELQDTTIILDDFRYQPIAMLMSYVYNGSVEGSTSDLVDLTKYAKELHVKGLVNDGSNKGERAKPLIELLETTSKAKCQLEQLNQMDSPSESEDELCIVFEKNTASCSKLPSPDVTKSKGSSKEHNSRKRQLSPESQSSSQVPLKKGTKIPTPVVPNSAGVVCSTPDPSATKKCSVCKEVFLSNESHRQHLVTAHAVLLTCSICNKLFTLRASLRKHLKRHIQSFDKLHLMGASVNLTPAIGDTADRT